MSSDFIKIGPSGWRVIFLKNLTANAFEAIIQAMAMVFGPQKALIGFDNRFLSPSLAAHAQKILKKHGWRTDLVSDIFSTPGVARLVSERKADWGLVVTASHNAYYYNGLKILDSRGCLVDEKDLKKIQDKANEIVSGIANSFQPTDLGAPESQWKDWARDYFKTMLSHVDVAAIKKSKLKIAWDGFGGTTTKLFPSLFDRLNLRHCGVSGSLDPTFGGRRLEPDEDSTKELMKLVKAQKCSIGMATDVDGDRFCLIDEKGRFVSNNLIGSLLLWYLLKVRCEKGTVFQTVSCSARNKMICQEAGVRLEEEPVGFQVMGRRMKEEGGLLGMEETGGFAYGPHLNFKDGLMAHLLVLEILATQKKSLRDLFKNLDSYGRFFYHRWDIPIEDELQRACWLDPAFWERSLNLKISQVVNIDGQKIIFEDGAWLLFRSSKTEPLFRIYVEGRARNFISKVTSLVLNG